MACFLDQLLGTSHPLGDHVTHRAHLDAVDLEEILHVCGSHQADAHETDPDNPQRFVCVPDHGCVARDRGQRGWCHGLGHKPARAEGPEFQQSPTIKQELR